MVRTLQRQQFHFRYILPFHKTTCPSKNYKAALRTGQCKNAAKWNNQLENKTHKSLKQTNKIYSNINKTTPVEKPLQSFLVPLIFIIFVSIMCLCFWHAFILLLFCSWNRDVSILALTLSWYKYLEERKKKKKYEGCRLFHDHKIHYACETMCIKL